MVSISPGLNRIVYIYKKYFYIFILKEIFLIRPESIKGQNYIEKIV